MTGKDDPEAELESSLAGEGASWGSGSESGMRFCVLSQIWDKA